MCYGLILVTSVGGQSVAVSTLPNEVTKSARVTLDVTDVTLESVLRMIAQQAHLELYIPSTKIPSSSRVTMHVRDMPADDAFEHVLAGTGFHAVIASSMVMISTLTPPMTQGMILGKVIDSKTQTPLRGVTVTLDDAKAGVRSTESGAFQFANVAAGPHVVRARVLGYAKVTKNVTVVDGETVRIEVALARSANQLDQVVVTGTVVPTELKAVPSAITVITAKELEERGITRIDQLFRGDVPGLFVRRTGSLSASGGGTGYPGAVDVWSRGTANLGGSADGIKTYVDGIELADKTRLALIDPTSIERIEILTGPQASAIYGSGAINGVMQIFTKRGLSSRPQLTADLRSAWTQNNFNTALAPTHRAELSASGVEGRRSYNVGSSWGYVGSWSPSVKEQTLSGFGGERITMGPFTVDANLRVYQDQNATNARDDGQRGLAGEGKGLTGYVGGAAPLQYRGTSTDRAMGGSVAYPMTTWWSHTVLVGLDQFTGVGQQFSKGYGTPADSAQFLIRTTNRGLTASYNTTLQLPITALAKLVLTLGVDESHTSSNRVFGQYVGAYAATSQWLYNQDQAHEHGGFLQSQVGVWDAVFFTYGLRAVYNPNIGADQNPNWEPHYGVAYALDIAGITAKVRASYGTATRPPAAGLKDGVKDSYFIPYVGTDVFYFSNPNLLPESQRGGEGGLELYFGTRGSLQVTRFNQTVDNLIINAVVDSVDMLPAVRTALGCAPWQCPLLQSQFLNIGSVRNQGWQGVGTLNVGVFTATGTYSWTKSRMIGITPKYRGQWPQFAVGVPFNWTPEHTYAVGLAYARGGTRVAYNLQGQGAWRDHAYDFFYRTGIGNTRSQMYRPRMQVPNPFYYMRSGYYLGDVNVSQRFTRQIEGLIQINNLHNSYLSENNPLVPQAGRTTGLGLRVRF